jgi:hypothetical protein
VVGWRTPARPARQAAAEQERNLRALQGSGGFPHRVEDALERLG